MEFQGRRTSPPPLEPSQSGPENVFPMIGEEEFEGRPGSENIEATPGDEQGPSNPSKRKRMHRHTKHQVQELEAFFKELPHPDEWQRIELARVLGLEPAQVKFWFQNKRNQMKTKNERHANHLLMDENQKLRAENLRYKEALRSTFCTKCSGPVATGEKSFDEHQLTIQNQQLTQEIQRISRIAARYAGKSAVGETSEAERPLIIELAVDAMRELLRMAEGWEPLWFLGLDNATHTLNEEEYLRAFPKGIRLKPAGWKTEATRDTTIVMMNPMSIVEILMDVNQWSTMFSSIVSKVTTMEVFSTGAEGSYNGALQVMLAEYQMPSPLIAVRESLFVRYCNQQVDGRWAIVDVSLDNIHSNLSKNCRRQPSGCLIQEMPNGYSKVIWVEHVEIDDRYVHALYKPVINSGLAFGAKRWVATLEQQCERLESAMGCNISAYDVGTVVCPEGRKSLLKFAERMVTSYCNGITCSPTHNWSNISEVNSDGVKIHTRNCTTGSGRHFGHVINAATSLWLPVEPRRLFDFLRNEAARTEWNILSNGAVYQEVYRRANGREEGNCISILHVDNKRDIVILQESCFNVRGSYVVSAPVDVEAMNILMRGGDPDHMPLIPSGFYVLPDGHMRKQGEGIGEQGTHGSLLTIALQILVRSLENSDIVLKSVKNVNNLISCAGDKIKEALLGNNVQ